MADVYDVAYSLSVKANRAALEFFKGFDYESGLKYSKMFASWADDEDVELAAENFEDMFNKFPFDDVSGIVDFLRDRKNPMETRTSIIYAFAVGTRGPIRR